MVSLGLTGVKSIKQAVRILILTNKGDVPFRPNFGLGALEILDGNKSNADIVFEVIDQLTEYEKRITINSVKCTGQINKTITIDYKVNETGATETVTVTT